MGKLGLWREICILIKGEKRPFWSLKIEKTESNTFPLIISTHLQSQPRDEVNSIYNKPIVICYRIMYWIIKCFRNFQSPILETSIFCYSLFKFPKLNFLESSIFFFFFLLLFPKFKKWNNSVIYQAIILIFLMHLPIVFIYKFCKKNWSKHLENLENYI